MPYRQRKIRQAWSDKPQIERTRTAYLGGQVDRTRIAREAICHLGTRAQVRGASSRQPAVHVVETTTTTDGGQCRSESASARCRVMRISGSNRANPAASG